MAAIFGMLHHNMSTAKEIQLSFLQIVKTAIPSNLSLVDELAELLNTSNDSAYRRMRGETLLSIDEIALICTHFKVAFETASHPESDTVTFTYRRLRNKPGGFERWISAMHENVKRIADAPGSDILYAADDVPIWHHFNNEELLAFKLFYWQKSILNDPEFDGKTFNKSLISSTQIETAKELLKNYNQIQSTEIWTEDTLNSTLKQIEYFWESGFFEKKEDAFRMCDHIEAEILLLKKKAEKSSKLVGRDESGNENFTLYQSEVMVGNNSILVTIGKHKITYVSNNTFNMMSTLSPAFVEESELWLKNLIRKSILISGVNEKQRNKFFRILKEKIDTLRNHLN